MRTTNLYQIYDRNAEMVVGPIMNIKGHGPAIRNFHDALATPETTLNKHPEDYDLIQLCQQNEETGEIIFEEGGVWPKSIAMGAAWLAEQQEKERK